ncbi:MAG: homoserine kinase [Actinobacteria bacterium]|nr:homoserine kinase [Actinomycetota bacterium]
MEIRVPASSANLGPGFDILSLALRLYCFFEIEESESGHDDLFIDGESAIEIENSKSNLVKLSYEFVCKKNSIKPKPLKIKIFNQIPVGKGMGSSSTAIVAGVVYANETNKLGMERMEVAAIASEIEGHPDNVSAAVFGGLCISVSDSECPYYSHTHKVGDEVTVLMLVPENSQSTHEARKVLPQMISMKSAIFNMSRTSLFVSSFIKCEYSFLKQLMEDRIHQKARYALYPRSRALIEELKKIGKCACAISGAGPAIICIQIDSLERCEDDIFDIINKAFEDFKLIRTKVDNEGFKIKG